MKAIIEHSGTAYIMSPDQAAEVLALITKYSNELWVSSYEKKDNKYVYLWTVEPVNHAENVRPIDIKLITDEAYGVAKMRYHAQEKK